MAELAFDFSSVREYDDNGHLRVSTAPISAAVISEYVGREIPRWRELGLDGDRIYKMFRPPEELRKAASTFRGKPILLRHQPVSADDHPREITIGAIGDSVTFDGSYLRAPLNFWDGAAIKMIERGERKSLSSGYAYTAEMQPGVWRGQRYDGRMTRLAANHLIIVDRPRVPGCVIGDAARPLWSINMKKKPILIGLDGLLESEISDLAQEVIFYLRRNLSLEDIKAVAANLDPDNVLDEDSEPISAQDAAFPHRDRLGPGPIPPRRKPVRLATDRERQEFAARFPHADRLKF